VGQDEDSPPLVRRAVLGGNAPLERFLSLEPVRREQARRRRVAQSPKLSQDGFEAEGDVTGDVFEEHPFRAELKDDPGDIGPEVPGIVSATAFPGRAEGLAGIACEDGVEGAAEGAGVEAAQVGPDRGRGEVACALGGG
jgi:hypothetical protein